MARSAAVLVYHRVSPPAVDPHRLCVAPDEFAAQMDELNRGFRVLPLDELIARKRVGDMVDRAVAVTFDDGYTDNLTTVSPIMSEREIPATFFLTTGTIGVTEDAYWWDWLALGLLPATAPSEVALTVKGVNRRWSLATPADRSRAHDDVYAYVKASPLSDRERLLGCLREQLSPDGSELPRRLSDAQIVELSSRPGHDIGAHTARHALLPLETRDTQRAEITECKERLETLVSTPVRLFSYPFGAATSETVDVVRSAGFRGAVLCGEAPYAADDYLRIPRLDPARRSGDAFRQWLNQHLGTS